MVCVSVYICEREEGCDNIIIFYTTATTSAIEHAIRMDRMVTALLQKILVVVNVTLMYMQLIQTTSMWP